LHRLVFPVLSNPSNRPDQRSDIVRCSTASGRPYMANRVLSILSRLFNWHASRTTISLSPVSG
jgi:hypothetical protein